MPVLMVVFDGLRPDFVQPEIMPALSSFLRGSRRFPGARSVFPSETRVACASVATGCYPQKHGLVGNSIFAPDLVPCGMLDTGDGGMLDLLERKRGGKLLEASSLGELLHACGKSLAVASSGSTGSCRLLHHRAGAFGDYRYSIHGPAACAAPDQYDEAVRVFGPPPQKSPPAIGRNRYLADVVRELVLPRNQDAVIVWFTDPDYTGHARGLSSPAHNAALASTDGAFGSILETVEEMERRDGTPWHVLTASDHGQIPLCGAVDPMNPLRGSMPAHLEEMLIANPGRCVELFMPRGVDAGLRREVCAHFAGQPWVDAVIENYGETSPYSLPAKFLCADHPLAPPVRLALRSGLGAADGCFASHGGLDPRELGVLLALRGSGIEPGVDDAPCGLIDIAPTILQLVGAPVPESVQGRALPGDGMSGELDREIRCPVPSRKGTELVLRPFGKTNYIDGLHTPGDAQ